MIVCLGLIDTKLPSNAKYLKSLISKTSRLEIVPYADAINRFFETLILEDETSLQLSPNKVSQELHHAFILCNFTHSFLLLVGAIAFLIIMGIFIAIRRSSSTNKTIKIKDSSQMQI